MLIIQRKRQSSGRYLVPAGGSAVWYGIADAIPAGWSIVNAAKNVFVMGADTGEATDISAGSSVHNHDNPAATSEVAAHAHPITGVVGATGSGSTTFFGSGSEGTAPGGHGHGNGTANSASSGAHSHPLFVTEDATVYPPYYRLYWIKTSAGAILPVGGIVMWDDDIANAPAEFSICDGVGDTPDLTDNFIYGASSDGEVDATGGAETHSHENANVDDAGTHSHGLNVNTGNAPSNSNGSGYAGTTVSDGGHDHGMSATSNSDPNHDHELGDTGDGSSLPPYLMLYFIMRTV